VSEGDFLAAVIQRNLAENLLGCRHDCCLRTPTFSCLSAEPFAWNTNVLLMCSVD